MSVTNALVNDRGDDPLAVVCEVRANGETTRYRRAGTGSAVLLLCCVGDSRFEPLFLELSRRHRVIAPLHPASDDEPGDGIACLAGFFDGLGLATVPVVGVDRCAGPAAAFASRHPERVERLVLLGEDVGAPQGSVTAVLRALDRGA